MAKKTKNINWEQAKENPEVFMKELAQIDNQGEMSEETLKEVSGGLASIGKTPIGPFEPPLMGIWYDPTKDPKFPTLDVA